MGQFKLEIANSSSRTAVESSSVQFVCCKRGSTLTGNRNWRPSDGYWHINSPFQAERSWTNSKASWWIWFGDTGLLGDEMSYDSLSIARGAMKDAPQCRILGRPLVQCRDHQASSGRDATKLSCCNSNKMLPYWEQEAASPLPLANKVEDIDGGGKSKFYPRKCPFFWRMRAPSNTRFLLPTRVHRCKKTFFNVFLNFCHVFYVF